MKLTKTFLWLALWPVANLWAGAHPGEVERLQTDLTPGQVAMLRRYGQYVQRRYGPLRLGFERANGAVRFDIELSPSQFSPQALRRKGRR